MNPPKMPIHIGDYKRDTGHLGAAQHGAYLLLLFHYWSTGSLPDDDKQLAAISCMSRGEWKKTRPIIEKFFQDGWRHGRVEKDLAAARESYQKRAKAGEKGGNAKAATKQSSSNATALPKLPLTLDQIPEEKKEEDIPSLRSGSQIVPRGTSSRWPEDFRERFWSAYPRKVGKLAAVKSLERAHKAGVDFDRLMAGIAKIPTQDPQFVPHPATWLNRGGWDDEEISGGSNGQRGPRPLQDDRFSASRAAERLIEKAERGEFQFGPRPSLLPESSEDDLRLLPKG